MGKLNATDRDQPGSLHVKIKYTLLDGLGLFSIHPETGVISTTTSNLDREASGRFPDASGGPKLLFRLSFVTALFL